MKKSFHFFCTLPFIFFLVQCSTPRMALDESLSANSLKVEGRKGLFTKERMRFGNYHTTAVKRSWTRGTSSREGWYTGLPNDHSFDNIISTEYIQRKQTVRFQMTDDNGNQSEVYCVARFHSEDLQIGNRPNSIVNIATELLFDTDESSSKYYVQLYTNKYSRPWELLLDNEQAQGKPKKYKGLVAMDKDNYYTLHPVTRMLNKAGKPTNILFGSVGFEIRNKDDKPVAAVSVFNKGVVYLAGLAADERFLLANICAAILMQEQLG